MLRQDVAKKEALQHRIATIIATTNCDKALREMETRQRVAAKRCENRVRKMRQGITVTLTNVK